MRFIACSNPPLDHSRSMIAGDATRCHAGLSYPSCHEGLSASNSRDRVRGRLGRLTSLLDGLLAIFVAALLHLVVVLQMRRRAAPDETRFLVRVYSWTVLLRGGLAIVLNVFAANSAFAAAFWGDSGSYDIGGYQLALRWSGEPVTTAYMSTAVSGYGWVYFVGVDLLRRRPQPAPRPVPERADRRPSPCWSSTRSRPGSSTARRPVGRPSSWRSSRRWSSGPPACTRTRRSSCASPSGHVRGLQASRAAVSAA